MELEDVGTQELIDEINRRDILEDIAGEDKRKWLKDIGIIQREAFHPFFCIETNMYYSLEYLNTLDLNTLKSRHNRNKKRNECD